jgi:undecaprenyl-diphosphatase
MINEANDAGSQFSASSKGLSRQTAPGLRSPGVLGRWPLIGLVMVLFGLLAFGVFAFNVQTNGPLLHNDVVVANELHQEALQSPTPVKDLMIAGYYVGQHVIVAIGALLALYFIYRRYWRELAMVAIAWAGEGSLWLLIAPYFNRPRPAFPVPIFHKMTAPSFPSGHTIAAVMCYGLLAYLIVPRIRSGWGKAVVIGLAVLFIAWVGFSRLFIGDHFLTDVLAGLALGIAWSGLVYTLVEVVARARKRREGQAETA